MAINYDYLAISVMYKKLLLSRHHHLLITIPADLWCFTIYSVFGERLASCYITYSVFDRRLASCYMIYSVFVGKWIVDGGLCPGKQLQSEDIGGYADATLLKGRPSYHWCCKLGRHCPEVCAQTTNWSCVLNWYESITPVCCSSPHEGLSVA